MAEAPKLVKIQLAHVGHFKSHPAGPFSLTPQVFSEIVNNWTREGKKPIVIDYEHASEADPTQGSIPQHGAPAAAWIHSLENRGDGGLWGDVEWLPEAKAQIRAGQYKGFSPAVRFGAKDKYTGEVVGAKLTSGALTNQPYLPSLAPLVAKDRATGETLTFTACMSDNGATALVAMAPAYDAIEDMIDAGMYKHEIEHHGGVDETLPLTETHNLDTDGGDDSPEGATMSLEKEATVLLTANAELNLKLKDAASRAEAAEAKVKELEAKVVEQEKRVLSDRVEEAFAQWKAQKNLSDLDKESMMLVASSNPALFDKLYPKPAHAAPAHLTTTMTARNAPKPSREDVGEGIEGVLPGENFQATTKRIMREFGLSYETASSRAFQLHRLNRNAG
jgi:phage I-like protein